MNISYKPNLSMEKFHNDIRIQNLVNICLENYYTPIFDDIVGAVTLPKKDAVIDFLEELGNKYAQTSYFQIFSTYKSIILALFDDSRIKNLKGAFLEVLAFKIFESHFHPNVAHTDCKVLIDGWESDLTVDIAMEYELYALCCECKVPTSKFNWDIFKNLLDIKYHSKYYFNSYAITLSNRERMVNKILRIKRQIPESEDIIDEIQLITRENLSNFNI